MKEGNTEDGRSLSDAMLVAELKAVQERISEREEHIAALMRQQASDQEEEKLLASLHALRTGQPTMNGSDPPARRRAAPHAVVDAVVAILDEAGRPLHISEIMVALRDRGVAIPGSGQQANVIAHIMRDDRIVRPMRGMYALAAWPSDRTPAPRARRRRVRSSSRTRTAAKSRSD